MHFHIKQSDIPTVVALSKQIPEFFNPNEADEYEKRLNGVPHLILVAYTTNSAETNTLNSARQAIGFKVGYEREGYFYSWMGGVLPGFRRFGIAKALADAQENWAKEQGYDSITFKTRNQHKGMLIFALKNGFNIIGFKEKESVETNRILLRKLFNIG